MNSATATTVKHARSQEHNRMKKEVNITVKLYSAKHYCDRMAVVVYSSVAHNSTMS